MATIYGMNRTARALRLNYYGLKKRVEQQVAATDVAATNGEVPFIELAPLPSADHCECLLELEKAGGARMRIQLKGVTAPDLAVISQVFWNGQP
jgi:hypothetical protein